MSKTILAAGTVCWRRVTRAEGDTTIMVLLIHRTKQRDVSFPKGKLDPGESMPEAAVRETLEETGLAVSLGVALGTIHYEVGTDTRKTVQYWAAEVTPEIALASTFTPNAEVQALEWVPLQAVRKRLSYRPDRELYDVFLRLAEHELIDTFSVTVLRHAKAEPLGESADLDRKRPLAAAGRQQAATLVPILRSFAPRRIYASTARRCIETVTPLAEALGKRLRSSDAFSQDTWEDGDLRELRARVGKIVSRRKNAIVCTHLPVLPEVAKELVLATSSVPGPYIREATALPPGGFSVFHFSRSRPGAGVLSVETYPLKH